MHVVARWCATHRLVVVGLWLLVLAAAFLGSSAAGSNYAQSTTLSGTPSATAASLLQRAVPGQSGDTEQIVFQVKAGTVNAATVRSRVTAMLGQVSHLANVSGVTSPYTPAGAKQVSADKTVAFATVNFDQDASYIPAAEATTFVNTARASDSANLRVEVVGDVAASTNPSSSSSTLIGVAAALVVLLLFFAAVLPALLPLIGTAISLVAGLSVVNMLSNSLTMASFTSQLCILIGLGVGIDYSLFILTRTRTGMRRGLSTRDAVAAAGGTAGRAVLFAGLTVCVALLGILTVGVGTLSGAAIAAAVTVAFVLLGALTLMPALVGLAGQRILTRRQRRALANGETAFSEESRGWARWASLVQRRRLLFGVAALGVMVALGVPYLSMRQGTADYSVDPTSTTTTTYQGYEMLVHGFGPGFSGPLQLVAPLSDPGQQAVFDTVVAAAGHAPGVVTTAGPRFFPAGPGHPAVALAEVYPVGSPQDPSTTTLINDLRDTVIPAALRGQHLQVLVGGATATGNDVAAQLSSKLPLFAGMVVALSFVLLMVVFRSLAIPVVAAVMNLLSAAASFGVITAVFQWGWLKSLVGVTNTGPVSPFIPILMFAVLFGLTTDYQVFLVSRIQEEWQRRRDNSAAVHAGQAITGRIITAAAAIMTVVFFSFTFTTDRTIKMIGLGMAAAVLADALIVRTVLVPAVMHMLGRANWRLPDALGRVLPHLGLEARDDVGSPGDGPAEGSSELERAGRPGSGLQWPRSGDDNANA
jgi:RND superfamily putative drug exporter